MNEQRKTELDKIGRGLFEVAGLEKESIDDIACSPTGYAGVLKRINAGNINPPRAKRFGFLQYAATAMALVVVSIVSFSFLGQNDVKEVSYEIEVPAIKPEIARPETPPPGVIESERPIRRAKYSDAVVENISLRKPQSRRHESAQSDSPPRAEFVALGLSSSPQQTADGGRVIRVELPAASLFAMGVNVPIENSSQVFRADLIVGPDGVTRAVKLVE